MSLHHLPVQALKSLELPLLKEYLKTFAKGELGKEEIATALVLTDYQEIVQEFRPVKAWLKLLQSEDDLPLQEYDDIRASLKKLKAEGYILDQEEVSAIFRQLINAREIYDKASELEDDSYLPLREIIFEMTIPDDIVEECDQLFTDTFEIREDASPELQRIQRSIERTKRQLDREFDQFLKSTTTKGYLSDTAETIRNGRRVLSVKAEHKRKIKGIIHDESSGGKVSYIEPQEILEINNDLFDLLQAKKREVLKLLRSLCKTISKYKDELHYIQETLVQLDAIRAKAIFGRELGAICPTIQPSPILNISKGKHPLLILHFRDKNEEVVPFDLTLHHSNRILVVSGPNAGGKTVLMKSVGILQLMVQSAIPVPVGEESEFGVFSNLFVDIGDQQSLEDDLSTYSSHLQNMRSFLREADKKTLVLIDELGSGTDPRIGGAIAEAILHELFTKGIHGVITTHYSNLKNYAHGQKGVVNAAMSFDSKDLKPTYELFIGKPGSSFAFELAEKSKLPKNIIAKAKVNAGNALVDIDKMLSDIQHQRKKMSGRIRELEHREKEIDRLRVTYEQMRKDLEARRKKLKMLEKEYDISKGVKVEQALREMINEIKEAKDLEAAKQLVSEQQNKKNRSVQELSKLEEEDWQERQKDESRKIVKGDFVKVRKTGTIGQVERIEKGRATIQTGNFQLQAKLKDLLPAKEPLERNREKSVQVHADPSSTKNIQDKLDIRGMPHAEASRLLDKYFDQALFQGLHRLEIIHGKGSGVLRQLVREKASKLSAVESVEHPPREAGGEGVSIISM